MGQGNEFLARMRDGVRPCVRFETTGARSACFLGGAPSLPPHVEWPTWNGKPLAFLAQIDLAETSRHFAPDWAPREGRLLFFYDAAQSTWGFDPADRGSWAVIYTTEPENESSLKPLGLPDEGIYRRSDLAARRGESFPSFDRLGGPALEFDDDEFEIVEDGLEALALSVEGNENHMLFGWPSPEQHDEMETMCQLVSNGVDCGGPENYDSEAAEKLTPGKVEWDLLLQLDSDEAPGMMWGDLGKLYFWVRREDARRVDFSSVWMILQCG